MLFIVLIVRKVGWVILPFLFLNTFLAQQNKYCTNGSWFMLNEYQIYNNQWGLDKVKRGVVDICLFNNEKSKGEFGWRFQMPRKSYGVVAYTEILYGNSPWGNTPNKTAIKRLKDIKKFTIKYDAKLESNGKKMNLSADLWILDKNAAIPQNIASEIMIWEYSSKFRANGRKKGMVITSQGNYYLKVGEINRKEMGLTWDYIAFVRENNRTSGTIPVKELLDFLVIKGYVSENQRLSSIEFGTELSNASGEITFSDYEINLE